MKERTLGSARICASRPSEVSMAVRSVPWPSYQTDHSGLVVTRRLGDDLGQG